MTASPGILAHLCDELHTAATSEDDARARFALMAILTHHGKTEGQMFPRKAPRAFDFKVDGDRVTYRIERHPGRSWLTYRIETRGVDLNTAAEFIVSKRLQRLTLSDLEGFAREPIEPFTKHIRRDSAVDAAYYARELANRELLGFNDSDLAMGWVARAARCKGRPPRWFGTAHDVIGAFNKIYGGIFEVMHRDFIDRARMIEVEAASLWREVLA